MTYSKNSENILRNFYMSPQNSNVAQNSGARIRDVAPNSVFYGFY